VGLFRYARYQARKKQAPTFDVYRRFTQYYRRRSRKFLTPETPEEVPPVPSMPSSVQNQNKSEVRELTRIAAVQELEEMETRMREDEKVKAIADKEKAGWNGVGKWAKSRTRRHTETAGLGKSAERGEGDMRKSALV
jgi:hypothetical protein